MKKMYYSDRCTIRKYIIGLIILLLAIIIVLWYVTFWILPNMPRTYLAFNILLPIFLYPYAKYLTVITNYILCLNDEGIFHVNAFLCPYEVIKWHEMQALCYNMTGQMTLKSFDGRMISILPIVKDYKLVYQNVYMEVISHSSNVKISNITRLMLKITKVIPANPPKK